MARVSALSAREYRVRVTPFKRDDAKPAKYTITLTEIRDLTANERMNAESEREIIDIEQRWERARDALDQATLKGILCYSASPRPARKITHELVCAFAHVDTLPERGDNQ
jgi:hypothetical protein